MIRIARMAPLVAACSLALLATACDEPVAPTSAEFDGVPLLSRAGGSGPVTVPFKAAFFTDLVSNVPDPQCGPLPMLLNTQVGSGQATQLGRFSVRIAFCVDATDILDDQMLTEGESLPYTDGVGTLTAANGDELHIEIAGAVVPSDHPDFDFEFQDPFTVVGGTGRFDGATGGGMTNSLVTFSTMPSRTIHEWQGTLMKVPGGHR